MFDLSGKVAVVTGGSRGLGRADCLALARAGADVVVTDILRESDPELQRMAEASQSALAQLFTSHSVVYAERTSAEIRALGRRSMAIKMDVTDRDQVAAVFAQVKREFGSIDILVNNAGTIARAPAVEHDLATWDRVLEVDLRSPFVIAQAIGATMVERGSGKVIFTASLLSFQGGILVPSYTAAKSGVAGLVKALANEWAPRGVNVNAIAPGYIATDNTEALRRDSDRSRAILERIPAGRWGEADDLAGATVFLASPASDYVSGTIIPVDGGWLAR